MAERRRMTNRLVSPQTMSANVPGSGTVEGIRSSSKLVVPVNDIEKLKSRMLLSFATGVPA
jgi:hypothetical protein